MEKPVEPRKEDCCNSGCNPCIFDIYEKQIKLYEKYLENGEHDNDGYSVENGISQLEYTEFIAVKRRNLCDDHSLIQFKRATFDSKKICWKPADHFLVKYSLNEITCTRAYTPVKIKNETKDAYDFAIIVKKYDNGVVSNFLYNLNEGCRTLWRGPYGHYDIQYNKFDKIVMIAQGTGLVAFIDIIDNILNSDDDYTKIILLYCCKCIDTILFRDELYSYKSYWNFSYEIYINSKATNSKIKYQEPIKITKLSMEDILLHIKPISSNYQFLICGSQQFNESFNNTIRKKIPSFENIVLF